MCFNLHIGYDPFYDYPMGGSDRRIRLTKKPRPLSDPAMRKNLLDFIQTWMSPIPKMIKKFMDQASKIDSKFRSKPSHSVVSSPGSVIGPSVATVGVGSSDPGNFETENENLSYDKLKSLHNELSEEISRCLVGLINLGPIGDKSLELGLLHILERMIINNKKLVGLAHVGMQCLFRFNPHLLGLF